MLKVIFHVPFYCAEGTTNLFHYYWHFIKADVWQIVEESQKTMGVLPSFNATFLTLVPK